MVAVADFIPAAGALYELALSRGEEVEPLGEAAEPPEGWVYVRHLSTEEEGLVPVAFLMETFEPPDTTAEEHSDGSAAVSVPSLANPPVAAQASDYEGSPGSPSTELAREEAAKAAKNERMSWRVALASFKPGVGAANFETAIEVNDSLELVSVEWEVPEGWALVKHLGTNEPPGMVPENCLGPWPEEKDEKSVEEQKAAIEEALTKEKKDKDTISKQLKETEGLLKAEKDRVAAAEEAKRQSLEALEAAAKAKEEMLAKLTEGDEAKAKHEKLTEVIGQMPRLKKMVDEKLEEQKFSVSDEERVAQLKADVQKLDEDMKKMNEEPTAQGEEGQEQANQEKGDGGEAEVPARAAPTLVKLQHGPGEETELIVAEKERTILAEKIQKLDAERNQTINQLTRAENRYLEAAKQLNAEDEAVANRDRIIHLLPRVKELLAPTQDELMAHLEAMASSIMKQAEESASVLLETLARTNDPQEALRRGFEHRLTRGASNPALGSSSGSASSDFERQDRQGHRLAPMAPGGMSRSRSSSGSSLFGRVRRGGAREAPSLPGAKRGATPLSRSFAGGSSSLDRFGAGPPTPATPACLLRPLSASMSAGSLGTVGRYHPTRQRPSSAKPTSHSLHKSLYPHPVAGRTETRPRQRLSMPDRMRRTISWRQTASDPQKQAAADAQLDELIGQQVHEKKTSEPRNFSAISANAGAQQLPSLAQQNRGLGVSLYKRGRGAADAHSLRLAHAREAKKQAAKLKMGAGVFSRGEMA